MVTTNKRTGTYRVASEFAVFILEFSRVLAHFLYAVYCAAAAAVARQYYLKFLVFSRIFDTQFIALLLLLLQGSTT